MRSDRSAEDLVEVGEPASLPPVLASLAAQTSTSIESTLGQHVVLVDREQLIEFAEAAKAAGFEMCVDVTAVDYLRRAPRFEVVVNLVSMEHGARLRIRTGVPGDDPTCPSLVAAYPGANFYEREAFDLMGIHFDGHPDLTRILMPDDWEGHPLRKDSSVGSVPVLFKSAEETP